MRCGETTFSKKEVHDILIQAGYKEHTSDYLDERARCFRPIDGGRRYVEVQGVKKVEHSSRSSHQAVTTEATQSSV